MDGGEEEGGGFVAVEEEGDFEGWDGVVVEGFEGGGAGWAGGGVGGGRSGGAELFVG